MTRLCCFAIFFLVVAIANWPYAYINAYSNSMGAIDPLLSNYTTQKTFTRSEKGEDLLRSSLKNILFGRTPRQRNYDFSYEIDPMRFSSN